MQNEQNIAQYCHWLDKAVGTTQRNYCIRNKEKKLADDANRKFGVGVKDVTLLEKPNYGIQVKYTRYSEKYQSIGEIV